MSITYSVWIRILFNLSYLFVCDIGLFKDIACLPWFWSLFLCQSCFYDILNYIDNVDFSQVWSFSLTSKHDQRPFMERCIVFIKTPAMVYLLQNGTGCKRTEKYTFLSITTMPGPVLCNLSSGNYFLNFCLCHLTKQFNNAK